MTETATQRPAPHIVGTIDRDQAAYLHQHEIEDPRSQEILQSIGATLIGDQEPAYAIVVDKDKEGNDVPLHFVDVTDHDLGTRVKPQNNEHLGLPDTKEAFEALRPKETGEQDATPAAVDTPAAEKVEKPTRREMQFTRHQIGGVNEFLGAIPHAENYGGSAEGIVQDHLASAERLFAQNPDENRSLLFVTGAIAAGALRRSPALDRAASIITRTDVLTDDERGMVYGLVDGIQGAKDSGAPSDLLAHQTAQHVSGYMNTLDRYEAEGRNVANIRIALAAIEAGIKSTVPELAQSGRDQLMGLMNRQETAA